MHKGYIILLIVLWSAPLLAWLLPAASVRLVAGFRHRDLAAPIFMLLAISAALYAFPSSASKGGTNPPPAATSSAVGRIRLYHVDADGRLVPLDARIREVTP